MRSPTQRILLLGATGLFGTTLAPFLNARGHETLTQGRGNGADYQADLCNSDDTNNLLCKIEPEVIINLVGLTDVDLCEAQPHQAYLANVRTVENISAWMTQHKASCHLVHISTDQVYDGAGRHKESGVTLSNYYAFSKYAGELAARSVPSTILRTNFFGRSYCDKKASLTDWLYHALSKGEPIQVFDDVLFSPLSMITLAEMIDLVVRKKHIGVFNLGSKEGMSKADFAYAFAADMGLPTESMTRTKSDEVTYLKTYRPKNMQMACDRFEDILDINLPFLRSEINRAAEEYS